uniref:26S proteasome non-ATPase regulatory subunit 1 n=1 Tax=Ciona savignyi TaxID=51511 RepID=H2Y5H3_CIOSA
EVLYEDETFKYREMSALLASKLYYYLGSYEDSLNYALCAGKAFNVKESSEYVVTTICKCIDHYTKLREKAQEDESCKIDPRLEEIVNRMFENCLEAGQYKQAIGIAVETRRLDIFERAVKMTPNLGEILSYCTNLCTRLIQNKGLREDILKLLVRLHSTLVPTVSKTVTQPDYINVCQCLIYLDDPASVSDILQNLIAGGKVLSMAYQIAFDMYDSAPQHFLLGVIRALRAGSTPSTDDTEATKDEEKTVKKLQLYLSVRNSVCHNACVIANSFMHCGTTIDQFLRDNLDWLARATNWAKFTATASLGVIHQRHEKDSLNLMSTYLPKDASGGSAYQEAGGLYAIGLIHANHGQGKISDYLFKQLSNANNEVSNLTACHLIFTLFYTTTLSHLTLNSNYFKLSIFLFLYIKNLFFNIIRHGGCLGLGLASIGTANTDVYELLKSNLHQDDAVTGEAAGLAMGLVMIGSNSEQALGDMVSYARETQHEKIIRGLAVGIALVMYGRMEEADSLIEDLSGDKDPILRRCAMYTIAMAYVGSGSNKANRKLLHFAVSDVNNDVRRAAVESLGFILSSVVSLLSESYNPHVRYGAAVALGIACAGTGNKDALNLLEPLTSDSINYVRQGSLIASAMILIQHTEATCPKVKQFKELYKKVITDKHEDVMAKYGAILSQGIIDAGGRNVTLSLQSRTGHVNMASVVGMLVFNQYWYWFPHAHFLSLTFTPSAIIGLNSDLKMPKMEFHSNAKPSTFAYPAPLEEKRGREAEKVETAVLSTTAKQKAKEKKEKKKAATTGAANEGEKMEVSSVKEEKEKEEATFEMINNPCRAILPQLKLISLTEDSRYAPLKPITSGGIILLKDKQAGEPEQLLEPVAAGGPKKEENDEEDEPPPPEPFEFTE